MSDYPQAPAVAMKHEDVQPGILVRCPGLECSAVTQGVIYIVLWKRRRYCSYRKGHWWAVALQRHNRPPYMWPKVVCLGHLEPVRPTGQLTLPGVSWEPNT